MQEDLKSDTLEKLEKFKDFSEREVVAPSIVDYESVRLYSEDTINKLKDWLVERIEITKKERR